MTAHGLRPYQRADFHISPYRRERRGYFSIALDFSYLTDVIWEKDTRIIIRSGDKTSIVDSPFRLLARAKKERGFHPVDLVELTADRGYLLWTNPRGSIEVKFKYGKTGDDFRCFIDPQYQGVKIYELKGYKKEMIIDGREAVTKSRNSHHMPKSPARHRENNFEFRSRDGEVTLLLEACREYNVPKSQAFKFNYVLAL
ncbi:uncharacterized protein LOC100373111 [Saccoglossus kowalevskii]|uniref:Uncharacterized protein LOC100373111 n=1 Tax=Saccoglossus kowalevskii TaxID=10224 RepID=A0ABM0M4U5_SACKO|nr:PREDICTED: uncharacterized protein LOC100373111 [Saccoglossus kowalevskii]